MRCDRCHGNKIGRLRELADASGDGVSYRAVSGGTFRQHELVSTNKSSLDASIPVNDPNKVHRELRHRSAHPWTAFLLRLFGPTRVVTHESATKVGAIEALVCAECGALRWQVEDPQWFPWENIPLLEAASAKDPSMKQIKACRRCNATKLGLLSSLPDTTDDEKTVTSQMVGVTKGGERVGLLQAVVCTECGLLEPFVAAARDLDFESMEGFSWIDGEKGPYR